MCVCVWGGTVGEAVVGHSPSTAVFRYVFPTLLWKPCLITPSVTCNLADKEGHLYPSLNSFLQANSFWQLDDSWPKSLWLSSRPSQLCWWIRPSWLLWSSWHPQFSRTIGIISELLLSQHRGGSRPLTHQGTAPLCSGWTAQSCLFHLCFSVQVRNEAGE